MPEEKPDSFEEAVWEVCKEIGRLIIRKQKDYGHRNILDFGELGILVRENDKVARLKNLILGNKPAQNESKTESWEDIAGYAVIALMLERGWFELELENK